MASPTDPSYGNQAWDPLVINRSSLHTDYTNATESFYSEGGIRDPKFKCQFICESPAMGAQGQPQMIELDLAPTGVSWEYNLRTQVFNTYGGQVVQILGVDISNVTISGLFGFESWFGKKFDGKKWNSLYNQNEGAGRSQQYVWQNDSTVKNGLMQMAHWFRAYFNAVTQPGYDQHPMYFSYPARGWWWPIRPRSFPTIRVAQESFAPTWVVQADYLQYLQDQVIQNSILDSVKAEIDKLTPGVGTYTEFLQFMEPQTNIPPANAVTNLQNNMTHYGSYVSNTSAAEAAQIMQNGLSFVWSGSFLTDMGIAVE
jgi:hypothetical protein